MRASGLPNFLFARLAVPSRLNIPAWKAYLQDYSDVQVCDFMEYGWPIGYDYSKFGFPISDYSRNHKGALLFSVDIDRYLYKERSACAVIGPFSTNPFSCQFAVSPLNSVPKADSEERRIIVDLSWPFGTAVNDGISSSRYLDEDISLVYPTVDSIASLIRASGPGALIYKRDLRRAYRQFPVDPFDYPLLGYRWNDELYFDVVLPMAIHSNSFAIRNY